MLMVAQLLLPRSVRQHSPDGQGVLGSQGVPKPGSPPSRPGKPPPAPPPMLPPMQTPPSVSHMFDAHEMHSEPATPWPHCWPLCALACTHIPEPRSQQPFAQFVALQPDMLPTQIWFVQVPFDTEQFAQKSPLFPQRLAVVPISQRPVARSTQPGHAVQAPATHV